MRCGKLRKDVKVADNLNEMPSHTWNHTCICSCGAIWKLDDTLYCPDCGNNRYEVIDAPRNEYAPEG